MSSLVLVNRCAQRGLFAYLLAGLFWLVSSNLQADGLDRKSFVELNSYITNQAGPRELTSLARRQFAFEIRESHALRAAEYLALQEAIARKIPNEYARPIFNIRFIFDPRNASNPDFAIGILGGIGPVSDANIIRLVLAKLQGKSHSDTAMIHLYSLPPPRSRQDQILGGLTYATRMSRFMWQGYRAYFLASNTAHLNFNTVDRIAGSGLLRHLPKMIANRIAPDLARNDRVLILGTKQAWDGRLYQDIFDEGQIVYANISQPDQIMLQSWIDQVKNGRLSDRDRIELKEWIAKLGRYYGTEVLLLACTELPLALAELMPVLRDEGFQIIDTEDMIATLIAEEFLERR